MTYNGNRHTFLKIWQLFLLRDGVFGCIMDQEEGLYKMAVISGFGFAPAEYLRMAMELTEF